MKLALFGNGTMGQLVRARAKELGHEVALVFTSQDAARSADKLQEQLRGHDAAIDFTVADGVLPHALACARAGVPLVEGTTGWYAKMDDVRRVVEEHGGAFIYGANFSIGVNLFYRIVARAAELFEGMADYAPFIEEAHHARKRDAPSGTALRLRDLMGSSAPQVPITSTRAGHIPGTHRVGFDSVADQIMLTHTARTREGFASGALHAARWIAGREGVYEFSEMLEEILNGGDETKGW
ncbi:MAG TPA: dihydrodipicolinate reductase C-terminal domain-containing protein [Pyrinomonadaceae bacterium]|jgi:4-hydroxy-tetrahydrodipicolinate reductase|nr:dihydrodipicolinate reductase C-terminal domain-containing protein [Pyrinomonadaceae bacterium]